VITQSSADLDAESVDARPEAVVHRLPFHQVLSSRDPSAVMALIHRVAALKQSFEPDLVHVHAVHPGEFFLVQTMRVAPCPLVFTLHGWTHLAPGEQTLRTRLLRQSDSVTGCSRHVVDRAILELPEIADRTETIYNGLRDSGAEIARLPFDPPRLLCIGRLVESKGFDDVLRVFPAVLQEHPGARLTLVGDGPYRPELERLCARLGLSERTDFAGAVSRDEVFAWLNASTLLVVPSRGGAEGLPMVALEAALMERPVVATRDGGLPEAVVDGRTGFLVESGDRDGLARSVMNLLRSPTRAEQLGRAGRRYVLDTFNGDAQVARYIRVYEKAMGAHSKT
jgi:glycosyltransferase involved in cell wall biosynthesis